jgi:hypothetical protein
MEKEWLKIRPELVNQMDKLAHETISKHQIIDISQKEISSETISKELIESWNAMTGFDTQKIFAVKVCSVFHFFACSFIFVLA